MKDRVVYRPSYFPKTCSLAASMVNFKVLFSEEKHLFPMSFTEGLKSIHHEVRVMREGAYNCIY